MNSRIHAALIGAVVGAALGAASCKSRSEQRTQVLTVQMGTNPTLASMLCGYPVRGLSDVHVTGLTYEATTGSATVRGTPFGAPAGTTCSAPVTFSYLTLRRYSSNRRGNVNVSIYNHAVPVRMALPGVPPATGY